MPAYPKPEKEKKVRKRRSKTEHQILDAECMELIKEIVRLRDGGCVTPTPSCSGMLTASHWQKRGRNRVRYDLRNVNCQCSKHNLRHNYYTNFYDRYMLMKYGYNVCLELTTLASLEHFKWGIPELREIRNNLAETLEKLKDENYQRQPWK